MLDEQLNPASLFFSDLDVAKAGKASASPRIALPSLQFAQPLN
jgi:hypothetical protein